jgi:predicted permease
MAWFLVGAAVVIVVAIAAAVIAWALVMRDLIRLVDRKTGSAEAATRIDTGAGALRFEEGRKLPGNRPSGRA